MRTSPLFDLDLVLTRGQARVEGAAGRLAGRSPAAIL